MTRAFDVVGFEMTWVSRLMEVIIASSTNDLMNSHRQLGNLAINSASDRARSQLRFAFSNLTAELIAISKYRLTTYDSIKDNRY